MLDKNTLVIIMCKAPVEGKVKTRLMSKYTAAEATAWHKAMASTVIERAKRLFQHVWLAADDVTHPFFEPFGLPMYAQGEGDLGARMSFLMEQASQAGFEKLLFLGTDSPHMLDKRLLQASAALDDYDVVLGAVEDGGYDLIAMNRAYPALFSGITWSSEHVLQQSVDIAQEQGLNYLVLEESFDVDTPDMLHRAQQLGWQVPKMANIISR
ncbi:TIGR04282 family arsenosugar biosynthesis glycosyltransferase [Mariprofundus ferrooxydans]|nr:TIGR04282 family arsenosugar biosynthesis glycosyltransferase [Mariprofundus ferrooxydans]